MLLSDDLAKHDTAFEQTVNKLADILTNLVKSDSTNGHVSEYMLVNDSRYSILEVAIIKVLMLCYNVCG